MEDGAVSIAGLVFGVAASTDDSSIVLLAGAAGAAAGAISMMAGTYLDVTSERDRAAALVERARARIVAEPGRLGDRIRSELEGAGFTAGESETVVAALTRNPEAMLEYVAAFELGVSRRGGGSPWAHAIWMFIADLIAASTPVIPFALLDLATARIVSLLITAALLVVLGIGRARVTRRPFGRTIGQTLLIAGAAAAAGVLIGRLVAA